MSNRASEDFRTLLGRGRRNWFPLIVLALGAAALLLFASTEWIHGRSRLGEERILALNRIQTMLAISHLWVEELVTGDTVDLDEIVKNLAESEALLAGIENSTSDSRPLLKLVEHTVAMETVAHAKLALARFVDISGRRIEGVGGAEDVGIGSAIDAQFDAEFASILTDLRALVDVYQIALDRNKARSQLLVRAVVIAWLLIVGLAVGGLWQRERRRVEAESALLESESRLLQSQKMDAVGRLAGGIAHDINNHLAAMTMQCEVVKLRAAADDPIIERMDSITAIGAKSADLIKRLLAFSRRQPVQPEVFNLQRIVVGMEKMLARLIGEDIRLCVSCSDDLWNVLMDPSQLEQVLLNLVINARDAMPVGGRIDISIENRSVDGQEPSQESTPPGDYVVLRVTDQGTGIPAEIIDKIYEPYFTTKDVSMSSGLGLATVHGIVTQNHGHIAMRSEEGSGTTFEIYLLRSKASESVDSGQIAFRASQVTDAIQILLVEDNEELCGATREILEELGYKVSTASDGEEALELFDRIGDQVNLVITDVVMPGIDGKELADLLREHRPHLPIIFVSGYTDDVMLHHGVEAGVVDFLPKPFSASNLAKTVRAVLGRESRQ